MAHDKRVLDLCRSMNTAGIEVIVCSAGWKQLGWTGQYDTGVQLIEHGVNFCFAAMWDFPIINLLVTLGSLSAMVLKTCALHRKQKTVKILYYNSTVFSAFPALLARVLLGVPIYIEFNDGNAWTNIVGRGRRIVNLVLHKIAERLLSGAILISTTMSNRVTTKNICVIPACFDWELKSLRKTGNGNGSVLHCLYGGSLDKVRGADLLCDTLELIEDRYPELARALTVDVVGKGPLENHVVDRLSRLRAVRAKYHGFVSRRLYREILAQADVGLCLQRIDHSFSNLCFPSKVLEYVNAGKVVISSAISDVKSVAGGNVLTYERDDPDQIASLLFKVWKNHPVFVLKALEAQSTFEKTYSDEAVGERLATLFSS